MVRIKDVAKEANVSVGTVSSVFNGKSNIKTENILKVRKAALKLGYKPKYAWKMLKVEETKSIGVIIPDITDSYFAEFARGAEDAAYKRGMTVFKCNSDNCIEKELAYAEALVSKGIDGIVLVKSQLSLSYLEEIAMYCKVILVDYDTCFKDRFDIIESLDKAGIESAMKYLFDRGHKNIAFISGPLESVSSKMKFAAYKETLEKKGYVFDDNLVRITTYNWYGGYGAMLDLLKTGTVPTAVLCSNDIIALGAMRALYEKNIKIPKDISIIGYGDIEQASYCIPKLTTIRQLKHEMGSISVEMLINRINEGKEDNKKINLCFDTKLMERESVSYARELINDFLHFK